jgi:hypothetical protein
VRVPLTSQIRHSVFPVVLGTSYCAPQVQQMRRSLDVVSLGVDIVVRGEARIVNVYHGGSKSLACFDCVLLEVRWPKVRG